MLVMMRDCGWYAWPILFLAILAAVAALTSLGMRFAGEARGAAMSAGIAALVLASLSFGLGVLGTMKGHAIVDAAVAAVDPQYANELRTEGYAEAQMCTTLGTRSGGAVALLAGAAVALALTARSRR